jgi:hypothetical protein
MDIRTGKDLDEYENEGQPVAYHLIDIADLEEICSLWYYWPPYPGPIGETGAGGLRKQVPAIR